MLTWKTEKSLLFGLIVLVLAGSLLALRTASQEGTAPVGVADGDIDEQLVTRLFGGVETGTGVDYASIRDIVIQPDGKILAAGDFLSFANRSQRGIARLNSDGSPDYSFYPVTNGSVWALALQPDGRILIGGDFTQVNGQQRNRVARLNANGTLDTTFQNPNVDNRVYAIGVQTDGNIVVGGRFETVGGVMMRAIARLAADGNRDVSFNPPSVIATSTIYTLAIQPDGKILAGGDVFLGPNSSYLGRLNTDGSFDNSFVGRVPDDVFSVKLLADGKMLVGGSFSFVGPSGNTVSRNKIARLNSNGQVDLGFRNVTEMSSCCTIYDIQVMPNGQVMIGGSFSYQNFSRDALARLESDGTFDAGYDPNVKGTIRTVYALAAQADSKLLVGGNFEFVRGQSRQRFVRLNTDASLDLLPEDLSLNSLTCCGDGSIRSITQQPDGKILLGGYFESAGGRPRRGVVRLNLDGTVDTSFTDPGITTFFYTSVAALVVQPDGKILVGGDFDQVNGALKRHIIRLNADGSLDTSFNTDVSDVVYSIALQPDGKVLIGGFFSSVDGQTRNRLARLNTNGSLDPSFDRGANFSTPYSISVLPDGKILANGSGVGQPNGLWRYNANGSRDATFTIADVAGGSVSKGIVQADGKIIIIGPFSTVNGQTRPNIARLNANGTLDASFQPLTFNTGTGSVVDVAIQPNGKILIAGIFTQVLGQPREGLARLNSDGTLDTSFQITMDTVGTPGVNNVYLQQDGRILIGGDFIEVNGIGVDYFARLLNGFAAPVCTYDAVPRSRTFTAQAAADTFGVTTQPGCAWTAASDRPWLTVTGGAAGNGNGTVSYSVAQNTTAQERTGAITVTGVGGTVVHTVTQSVAPGFTVKTAAFNGPAVAIPDNNPAGVNIVIPVTEVDAITDLNFRFDGTAASADPLSTTVGLNHSWIGDLTVKLTSPAGTTVTIIDRPGVPANGAGCNGNNLFNLTLDDEGAFPSIEFGCPAGGDNGGPLTGNFSPENRLTQFDDQTAPREVSLGAFAAFAGQGGNGNWTLNVSDGASQDTGSVRAFSLVFTTPVFSSSASVSGRVTAPDGRGLRNAIVSITDPQGVVRTATTSAFGFYTFTDVATGASYTMRVSSKRYRFSAQIVNVGGNLSDINFTGTE